MATEVFIRKAGVEDAADVAVLLTELNRTVGIVGADRDHDRLPENTDLSVGQVEVRLRRVEGVETVLIAYAVEGAAEGKTASPEGVGTAAGFTSVRIIPYLDQDTPYAEATQLYVRPRFRRQGIASRLVEAAEALAIEAQATCLHILTGVDNLEAQAFYRNAGYEIETVDFQKFFERRRVNA